jgi:FkbM family methyltransferase
MNWIPKEISSKLMISQHYFTFVFYLPRLVGQIRNWPSYLWNYLSRRRRPAEYRLRNGWRLIDGTGTLAGTIAVVFVRREYGRLSDLRTIVDIGANMGSFTIFAAMNNPNATIYSFEPEKRNFDFLRQNVEINSLEKRVHTFPCAVSASAGQRKMAIRTSPLNTLVVENGERALQTVDCVSLQSILHDHGLDTIDLLKMNCEGAEYEILENCASADFARLLNIRLEYHTLDSGKRNGDALAKFLEKQGYRIQRFTRYRGVSGFIWATRV